MSAPNENPPVYDFEYISGSPREKREAPLPVKYLFLSVCLQVPDALLLNTVQATKPMPNILGKLSGTSYSELTQCTQEDSLTPTGHLSSWITDSKEEIAGVLVDASLMEVKPYLKG